MLCRPVKKKNQLFRTGPDLVRKCGHVSRQPNTTSKRSNQAPQPYHNKRREDHSTEQHAPTHIISNPFPSQWRDTTSSRSHHNSASSRLAGRGHRREFRRNKWPPCCTSRQSPSNRSWRRPVNGRLSHAPDLPQATTSATNTARYINRVMFARQYAQYGAASVPYLLHDISYMAQSNFHHTRISNAKLVPPERDVET